MTSMMLVIKILALKLIWFGRLWRDNHFWMRNINSRWLFYILHVRCTCVEVVQYATTCHRLYTSLTIWQKSRILGSSTSRECTNVLLLLILVHKTSQLRRWHVHLSAWMMFLLTSAYAIATYATCINTTVVRVIHITTGGHWYFVRLKGKTPLG